MPSRKYDLFVKLTAKAFFRQVFTGPWLTRAPLREAHWSRPGSKPCARRLREGLPQAVSAFCRGKSFRPPLFAKNRAGHPSERKGDQGRLKSVFTPLSSRNTSLTASRRVIISLQASLAAAASNTLPLCRVKGFLLVNITQSNHGLSRRFVTDRQSLFFDNLADRNIRPGYDQLVYAPQIFFRQCRFPSSLTGLKFYTAGFLLLPAQTIHCTGTYLETLCYCLRVVGLFICLYQQYSRLIV